MRKNFKKALFSIFTAILVLSMTTTSFAAVVNYGSEYTNQPTKSYSVTFKDVNKNYWAFGYIGEMVERGVLSGYPNGYFYPENTITRAEFSKIMCLAASLDVTPVEYTSYADVDASEWYAPYVETGKYYLSGYVSDGNKYYMPEANALREDIAVALVKLKGYNTSLADESILKAMFTDYQSISSGARKYVAIAVENELISGYEDNTFRGQSSITRAEAATLLWRAYQYGNSNKVFEKEEFDEPALKSDNNKNDNKQTIKKEKTTDDDDDDDREVTKPTKPETKTDTEPKQEEYVEPVPEYTHEVKTIANGVTNLDVMTYTDDGIVYLDHRAMKIYAVPADGKKSKCVFDSNELPYLGEDNLSKAALADVKTDIVGFGYNYYDSCLYAIISQFDGNSNIYLYNITDDEITADMTEMINTTPYGFGSRSSSGSRLAFDKNGYLYFDKIYDISNMKIIEDNYNAHDIWYGYADKTFMTYTKPDPYEEYIKNDKTGEKIDYYIKGNPKFIGYGANGCYFTESDNNEFYCVDSKGNEKFLFSIDDIDIVDDKRFDINTIVKGDNIWDESWTHVEVQEFCTADASGNIYFWDSNYSCIRQISEK